MKNVMYETLGLWIKMFKVGNSTHFNMPQSVHKCCMIGFNRFGYI